MGFWDKAKEKAKDIFGGKEETTKKEKKEAKEQKSKTAVDVGKDTDSGGSERTGGYTKTGGEPTGDKASGKKDDKTSEKGGTGGGGKITSTSGSVKSKEQAKDIEKELQKSEARKKKQKTKDKLDQKTTKSQSQRAKKRFEERAGFGDTKTFQEELRDKRRNQQATTDIKGRKQTTVSKAKDRGYSDYTSPYDQSVGKGISQSFKNIAGMGKKFFEGKRGEDLYGDVFKPLKLSGKTGAQEKVIVDKKGEVVFSNPDKYPDKVIDKYLENNPGSRLTTKGQLQDISMEERETQYEEKLDKLQGTSQRNIERYRNFLQKKVDEGDLDIDEAEESFESYKKQQSKKFKERSKKIKTDEKLPFSRSELVKTKGEEVEEAGGTALDIGAGLAGGPAAVGYFTGKGAKKASKARGGTGDSSITGSTISPEESGELTFYFGGAAAEGGQYLRNIERGIVAQDFKTLGKQPIRYKGTEFKGPGKSRSIVKAEQKYGDLTREFDIYGDVVKTGEGRITTMPSGKVTTKTRGTLPYDPYGGSGKSTKALSQQEFAVGSKSMPIEELGEGYSAGKTKLFPKEKTSLLYEKGQEPEILKQLKRRRGKEYKKIKSGFEKIGGDSFEKTYGLSRTRRRGTGDFGGELYESSGVGVTGEGKFKAPTVRGTTEVVELPSSRTTGFTVLGPGQKRTSRGVKYADDLIKQSKAPKGRTADDILGTRGGTSQGRSITGDTGKRRGLKVETKPKTVGTTEDILRQTSKSADTTLGIRTGSRATSGLLVGTGSATKSMTDLKGSVKTGLKSRMKGKVKTRADTLSDLRSDLKTESDVGTRAKLRSDTDLMTRTQPPTRIPSGLRTPFGSGAGSLGFPRGAPGYASRPGAKSKRKLKGRGTRYTPSVTALSLGIKSPEVSELYKRGGGGLGIRPIIEKRNSRKKKKNNKNKRKRR